MKNYFYRARDKGGDIVKGKVEAANEAEASGLIASKDLILIELEDENRTVDLFHFQGSKHVSQKEVMIFSRQLSGMLQAGLPVSETLATVAEDEKNKYFASVIQKISEEVGGGQTLSKSIEAYPKIFSKLYLSVIRVGEESGTLSDTFKKLAKQVEKDYLLNAQIKGAMIYPIFIFVTLISVAILAVTFVFPKLIPILTEAKVELPLMTKVLIFFTEFVLNYWYGIIPVVTGIVVFSYLFTRKGKGQELWSKAKLYIPIAGPIIKNIYMARFLRTFSILTGAGINIVETLQITSGSIGNINFENSLLEAAKKVEGGQTLAEIFKDDIFMSNIVKKMIKIGERTGALDTVTQDLANFYEQEVEYQVSNLAKTLEPLLVIIMGVAVAFFLMAVMLPLYDATTSIGQT